MSGMVQFRYYTSIGGIKKKLYYWCLFDINYPNSGGICICGSGTVLITAELVVLM